MARDTTIGDHGERIARVVAVIGERLEDDLDLETLAGIACFSPHHFHRVYRSVMRETPAETLRRLRLHRAAAALRNPRASLTTIARRAGYASVDAFSRAFTAAYGRTPRAYRAGAADHAAKHGTEEIHAMYDVTIDTFTGVRLLGSMHHGAYPQIGTTFSRVAAIMNAQNLFGPATRTFAIYYDDPASIPVDRLRSFAGFSVGDGVVPPPGTEIVEIAPAIVATLLHKGPYAELETAYKYLYGAWLPLSGREPANQPCFEEYLNDPRALPPTEWLTRVAMPLAV